MKVSRRTLRRMENLKGVCEFDTKTGVAVPRIHYGKAEEILDTAMSRKEIPVVRPDAVEYIQQILDGVPQEFDVRISLTIDDCQGYDRQTLLEAYNRAIETMEYTDASENKKKKRRMAFFAVIGLVFLAAAIIANKNNWFGGAGKALSMVAVILIELLFEVYFEESLIFFTVIRGYRKVADKNTERFKGLFFDEEK